MAEQPRQENGVRDPEARIGRPVQDLAAEAERARTQWTPLLAFGGVWLVVAATVVAILVAVALTLYLV
jgi:hypothetical protein